MSITVTVFSIFLFNKLFPLVIAFASGSFLALIALLRWATVTDCSVLKTRSIIPHQLKSLHSVDAEPAALKDPIVPGYPLLSESVHSLIHHTVNCFIKLWYLELSPSNTFPTTIEGEIRAVATRIAVRIQRQDLAVRIAKRIIPELHDHLVSFIKADSLADSVSGSHVSTSKRFRDGNLHPALTHSSSELEASEKSFWSFRSRQIASLLLLEDELKSKLISSLLVEILGCTAMYNIVQLLSDSDTFNLAIVKFLGDNLKHRDQDKQLRAALDQHSKRLNTKASTSSLRPVNDHPRGRTDAFTVSTDSSLATLRQMISGVARISTENDLASVKQHVLDQLRTINNWNVSDASRMIMVERLQLLKKAIADQESRLREVPRNKDSSAWTLQTILNSYTACRLFSHYLKTVDREVFLDFWRQADQIMSPLDDATDEALPALSLEFPTLGDVEQILLRHMDLDQIMALDVGKLSKIKQLLNGQAPLSEEDSKFCRRALITLQGLCFQTMLEVDFDSFKDSIYFETLLKRADKGSEDYGATTASVGLSEDESVTDSQEHISHDVLQAVELELTRIVQGNKLEAPSASSQMFGDESLEGSSMRSGESRLLEKSNNLESSLFDDVDDGSDSDADSVLTESSIQDEYPVDEQDSQIYHASPATLNFADEITSVSSKIDTLTSKLEIVAVLMMKAELSNKTSQIKLLRQSQKSLDQELTRTKLQHQQLMLQQDENSLYLKLRVSIQSCITDIEDGRDVILYVVEVQKLDSSDKDVAVAGWMVARRFSQFYKLHEYLKPRYLAVSKLIFPNRMVQVLKTQQRITIEKRKVILEKYLQDLIQIPQVCSDETFRSFLSSENFEISATKRKKSMLRQSKPQSHTMSFLYQSFSLVSPETFTKMETELQDFDRGQTVLVRQNRSTFVRPICDLLVAVFNLNTPRAWLRGRAMVAFLQRIFGTTIENKVHGQVERLFASETRVNDAIQALTCALFPNGQFRDPPPLRTPHERMVSKQEARSLLHLFLTETCAGIFGVDSTSYASRCISRLGQNSLLNKNFVYTVLDIVMQELFPEIYAQGQDLMSHGR